MAFSKQGALIERVNSTASSGGTLALANNSASFQQITGTLAHTVVLPDGTTCSIGLKFVVMNRSTDSVVVNSFGGALLATVAAGSQKTFRITDISTSAGVWDVTVESSAAAGFSEAEKLAMLAGLSDSKYSDVSTAAALTNVIPEGLGGNFWVSRAALTLGIRGNVGSGSIKDVAYSVAGTNNLGNPMSTMEAHNFEGNFWAPRTSMTSAGRFDVSVFTISNSLFVTGGQDAGSRRDNTEKYDPATNSWATRAVVPVATDEMFAFTLDNLGYCGGGSVVNNVGLTAVYAYNDTANAWFTRQQLPVGIAALEGTGVILGGYGYIAGGYNGGYINTTYALNPSLAQWQSKAVIGSSKGHGMMGGLNGEMVYVGGNNGSSYESLVQSFMHESNIWRTQSPLPVGRGVGGAVANVNGFGMQTAGDSSGGSTDTSFRYSNTVFTSIPILKNSKESPTAIMAAVSVTGVTADLPVRVRSDAYHWQTFTSASPADFESLQFSAAPLGYMVGGSSGVQNDTVFYNDTSNSWATRLNAAVNGIAAPGSFSLAGLGYISTYSDTGGLQNVTKRYDDVSNTWTNRANNPQSLAGAAGFSIEDRGHITGGSTVGLGFNTFNSIYSATTNSWTVGTPLVGGRTSHGASATTSFGLVAGGVASGTRIGTVEKYTPSTGAWVNTTSIGARNDIAMISRGEYTWEMGGQDNGPSNLSNVNYFNYATATWTSSAGLPTARRGINGHAFRIGEALFVAGGYTSGPTADAYRFSPENNSWATVTSMPYSNYSGSAIQPAILRKHELQVGVPTYLAALGSLSWIARANLPVANAQTAGANIGGKDYTTTNGVTYTNIYNKEVNLWRYGPNTLSNAINTSCGANGSVWTWSGNTLAFSRLDAETDAFVSRQATNVSGRAVLVNGSLRPMNGFILICGGGNTGATVTYPQLEQYNVGTNTWTTKTSRANVNTNYSGAFVSDGLYYSLPGMEVTRSSGSNGVDRWNDASDTWITRANHPTASSHENSATVLNGLNIVQGNRFNGATYRYNQDQNAWLKTTDYPVASSQTATSSTGLSSGGTSGAANATSYLMTLPLKNIVVGAALKVNE